MRTLGESRDLVFMGRNEVELRGRGSHPRLWLDDVVGVHPNAPAGSPAFDRATQRLRHQLVAETDTGKWDLTSNGLTEEVGGVGDPCNVIGDRGARR